MINFQRQLKRVRTAGTILRSRFMRGGAVLLYHRVAADEYDPYDIRVTPKYFEAQMAYLRQWANPMSLDDLLEALSENKLPRRAIAITFDDGYLDNLEHALPILQRYNIPATLFYTHSAIGEPYWWDTLAAYIIKPATLPPEIILRTDTDQQSWLTNMSRQQLLGNIHSWLRILKSEPRDNALDQLKNQVEAVEVSPGCRAMTKEEFQQFSQSPLITVGAHTMTHRPLSSLSGQEQIDEFIHNKRDIIQTIDQEILTASYPFGRPGLDYNDDSIAALQAAGIPHGFIVQSDLIYKHTPSHELSRIEIKNLPADRFSRYLRLWLN